MSNTPQEGAWRDYAMHLEHCRACAEDPQPCEDGARLKLAALASPSRAEVAAGIESAAAMQRAANVLRELRRDLTYMFKPGTGCLNWTVDWIDKVLRSLDKRIAALRAEAGNKGGG